MTTPALKVALSIAEAAAAVGVSEESIRRAIHSEGANRLPAKRSAKTAKGDGAGKYLISVKALEAWFEGLVDA